MNYQIKNVKLQRVVAGNSMLHSLIILYHVNKCEQSQLTNHQSQTINTASNQFYVLKIIRIIKNQHHCTLCKSIDFYRSISIDLLQQMSKGVAANSSSYLLDISA